MIEKTVYTYLNNQLNTPVYMGEVPATHPNEYVVLKTVDNTRTNMIDAITFYISSYSTTLQKAAELNALVKNAMWNIAALDSVASSQCGGGGQSIDVTSKKYAYECIFNLYYYE